MARVVVIDDQNLVLEGLCSLLDLHPEIDVVARAHDAQDILTFIETHEPDVVILDVRMPKFSGIDALKMIRNAGIDIPVMLLSTFDEHDLVLESIRLGAQGYLRKDISFQVLTEAVLSLHQGKRWFQPAVTQGITSRSELEALNNEQPFTPLSDSELEILRLIAAGFSNAEIASALFKSTGTVRNQVSSILTKLVVRDRTRAVLRGIELKLI
ncbi:response regulator transcription factor [Photobacterium atrarenae]|uniref:Response regulator transcription factor n=1 Tax=Photobacterium atrarenae TaxID=865757 RepID=A0ABY5GMX9_9GAMM|nr:response regulator transcription factor [Photobacterium atrarenae]UTV30288.1 response regulator transcription factor [Photobacterium atrarenae]